MSSDSEDLHEFDAKELDRANIAARLKEDSLRERGAFFQKLADKTIENVSIEQQWKAHKASITSLAVYGEWLYTAAKDGSIIRWNWQLQQKDSVFPAKHIGAVLCLTVSHDGQFLASGGSDHSIAIWDTQNIQCVAVFKQHRDIITSLAFSRSMLQLYSGSMDRTVMVWNISDLGYIETLYGHQEGVASVDSLFKERAVSVGLRDRTARLWKIVEESQLVYRPDTAKCGGSLECIRLISEDLFVTGSDAGILDLWHTGKKKPIASVQGHNGMISAMATVPNSDLLATGSCDGLVKIWKVDGKSMELLQSVSISGWINGLSFAVSSSSGEEEEEKVTHIFAAVAKDHRLGRWNVLGSEVKGGIYSISLQ